jgi:hypothetical protein
MTNLLSSFGLASMPFAANHCFAAAHIFGIPILALLLWIAVNSKKNFV